MFHFFLARADPERRAALAILVSMRWVLIGAGLFQVNYRPGTDAREFALLNGLLAIAAFLNALLQSQLAARRSVVLWFPILLGFYDVIAITGAIAAIDGFDNQSYILYYPALLSFVLVFPGRWSVLYTGVIMLAYSLISTSTHDSFDESTVADQKALVLRLLTMATAALTANLVVRIERRRRMEAVAAEARRNLQALAAEQRALDAERQVESERRRLSQEVHDGVSQDVFMLSLGLETAVEAARRSGDTATLDRLAALHRLSRETLLETRNLLFDLGRVMSGEASIADLVRNQASEFSTIAGIAVDIEVSGQERTLDAATVGEVFRMVQEGLSNALKHSGAGRVHIGLDFAPSSLALTISDDGEGFDPGAVPARGHGLQNLRDRAVRLHGGFDLATSPGEGTTLTITVPLPEEAP